MAKSRYFPHKGLSHWEVRQVIFPHIQYHMTILKNHQVHDRSTRTYQFTTLDINRGNLSIRWSREPGILKYRLNFRYSSLCCIYQRTGTFLVLFLCSRFGQEILLMRCPLGCYGRLIQGFYFIVSLGTHHTILIQSLYALVSRLCQL